MSGDVTDLRARLEQVPMPVDGPPAITFGWDEDSPVTFRDMATLDEFIAEHCAAHDAEVAARAWDEGMAQAGVDYMAGYDANVRGEPCPPPTQNPYRVAGHTPQEQP